MGQNSSRPSDASINQSNSITSSQSSSPRTPSTNEVSFHAKTKTSSISSSQSKASHDSKSSSTAAVASVSSQQHKSCQFLDPDDVTCFHHQHSSSSASSLNRQVDVASRTVQVSSPISSSFSADIHSSISRRQSIQQVDDENIEYRSSRRIKSSFNDLSIDTDEIQSALKNNELEQSSSRIVDSIDSLNTSSLTSSPESLIRRLSPISLARTGESQSTRLCYNDSIEELNDPTNSPIALQVEAPIQSESLNDRLPVLELPPVDETSLPMPYAIDSSVSSSTSLIPVTTINDSIRFRRREERILRMLICMYRCRVCLPIYTVEMKFLKQLHFHRSIRSSISMRSSNDCCASSSLRDSLSASIPAELIQLMQSYSIGDSVSLDFLTNPLQISAGTLQCLVIKQSSGRYSMKIDMKSEKMNAIRQSLRDRIDTIKQAKDSVNDMSPRHAQLTSSISSSSVDEPILPDETVDRIFADITSSASEFLNAHAHSSEELQYRRSIQKQLLSHAVHQLSSTEIEDDGIFLLSAAKSRNWLNIPIVQQQYKISTQPQKFDDIRQPIIAKVSGSFQGTQFTIQKRQLKQNQSSSMTSSELNTLLNHVFNGQSSSSMDEFVDIGRIRFNPFFSHPGSPIRIKIKLNDMNTVNQSSSQSKSLSSQNSDDNESNEAPVDASNVQENDRIANERIVAANQQTQKNQQSRFDSVELPPLSADLRDSSQSLEFTNLQPIFSQAIGAFVLSFDDNRITQKSIKNFKLIQCGSSDSATILQFGRSDAREKFILDFSYPLSPLLAFSIALASLDPKLSV